MKIWFEKLPLIGVATLLVGALLFLIGFSIAGFDIRALGNIQIVEKSYEENTDNPITNLSLDMDTTDIKLVFDDSLTGVKMQYPQKQNKRGKNINTVTVAETENTLTVKETENFTPSIFNFTSATLTLRLPTVRTYDLTIKTATGDIVIPQGDFNSLSLKATTGDITLSNAKANDLNINVTTGDVRMQSVSVNGEALIETTTGDITLSNAIIAENLSITVTTGDVKISETLTAKTLSVQTTTGDLKGKTAFIDAEKINISTTTGEVTAKLIGAYTDYSVSVKTRTGDSNIGTNLDYTQNAPRSLTVKTTTGDIKIYFA